MSGQVLPFDGQSDFTVSIIREAIDRLPKPIGFRDAISGIKTGRWAKEVCAIQAAYLEGFKNDTPVKLRGGEELTGEAARDYHGKESCAELKKQLPAILFSGTFSEREAKKLVKHSGLIAADLDHLGDRVAAIKEQVCSDPHVLAAFVSPSGSGLKLVCRCDPDRPHEEAYQALEHYMLLHFGLEIDKKCKDVSRMCFVSYDAELFSADDCEVIPYPPKAEKQKTDFILPPRTEGEALKPGEDYNLRGGPEVPKLMEEAGWKKYRDKYWTRPGKETGISASWNHFPNTLIVFSESGETGFPADQDGFDPFAIYAHLKCGGDFKKATKELGDSGWGDQTIRKEIAARKEKAAQKSDRSARETPPYNENAPISQGADEEQKSDSSKTIPPEAAKAAALAALMARRVTAANPPVEPVTRLFLAGKPVATPGNIQTMTAKAKTGKTAATGAAIASIVCAASGTTVLHLDTFKFTASNPQGHAVIVIDTEQSQYDAWACYQRNLARAGTDQDPPWLLHFALVGYNVKTRKEALSLALDYAKTTFGGVFLVILDGVAHFVNSVNELEECNILADWLRELSVIYDTAMLCIIHSNEGIKTGDDSRGHLGKQLMRDAESNLLLKKTGEITTITSERQRKAPITDSDGVAFKWSDEHQRHVTHAVDPEDKAKKGGRPKEFTYPRIERFIPEGAEKAMPINAIFNFAKDIGIKESSFRALMEEGTDKGWCIRIKVGAVATYYRP